MATCSAGRCRIACTGGCGCVYVWDTDQCICECFDSNVGGGGGVLTMGSLIDITVAGLDLGRVAARLDSLLAREVLVPAARTREKVKLKLQRVSFATALKTLGLTTRVPVKPKRKRRR